MLHIPAHPSREAATGADGFLGEGVSGNSMGLTATWSDECFVRLSLNFPGDVLALYTDGITEASNEHGEEFGEHCLIDALRQHRELPCKALLAAIVDGVRQFSFQEQHDDITAIVAKVSGGERMRGGSCPA